MYTFYLHAYWYKLKNHEFIFPRERKGEFVLLGVNIFINILLFKFVDSLKKTGKTIVLFLINKYLFYFTLLFSF